MIQVFAAVSASLALIAFAAGYKIGGREAQGKLERLQVEVAAERKVFEREYNRLVLVGKKLEGEVRARSKSIRTVTKEVVREIPKLVGDGVCINDGWVRVHDAAAGVSVPAGEFVGPSAAVTAARAAEVVAENYGDCLVWREQLLGWQKWWGEVNGAAN